MNPAHLIRAAIAGLACTTASLAFAGTGTGTFNVQVSLTSGCQARGTPVADFGAYTAFAAAKVATATLSFRCTKSLGGTPTILMTDTAGSVAGIAYGLSLGATTSQAAQAGDSGVTGTYDVYNATVTATMTGPQAGDLSQASTATHNITISF